MQKKKRSGNLSTVQPNQTPAPLGSMEGIKEQLANQRLLLEDYKARYFATKGAVEMLEAVLKSMLDGDAAKEEKKQNV